MPTMAGAAVARQQEREPEMNGVTLSARAHTSVREHAATASPLEACGMLIGVADGDGVRVTRALACPNVAALEERGHRFEIDPRAVINVRRALRGTAESVVGFYHSHPSAEAAPSASDMVSIRLWPETLWVIVPVQDGEAGEPRAWWLDEAGAPAARELAVRVPPPPARLVACPE